MGQILHRSATTTEAIRRAIQHSQESLRTLSRRHGINPKTVAKWRKRSSTADHRTGPTVPKSTVLSIEQEAVRTADVDAFTRECLALEVDTGFASRRVTRVLDQIIAMRGLPQAIRCDNGAELNNRLFRAWALEWKIELRHIQPGKPTQNAHVESFHGRLRDEWLRVSWFTNLFHARRKVTSWKGGDKEQRPHSSLGYKTPAEFARVVLTSSYGKDVSSAHLENAYGVSHFPIAPATG